MESNILLQEQDIFTITPIIFASLIGVMWITGKWKRDIALMAFLFGIAISSSFLLRGMFEESLYIVNITGFIVVIFAIFRKGGCRDEKKLLKKIKKKLKREEGVRNKMYLCPAGHPTIGVGHNLDMNPISDRAVEMILEDDIESVVRGLDKKIKWWRKMPESIQIVLVDLAFNLGLYGLLRFKKTLKLLKKRDFEEASRELLRSRYAKQLPKRAKRNAELIKKA